MAVWRRKAIENFPHLRSLLTHSQRDARMDFHWLCINLLLMVREEPTRSDPAMLSKVFAYAEWCADQQSHMGYEFDVIALAFYEHLFDHRDDWDVVIPYLTPRVICMQMGLWEMRAPSTLSFREVNELRQRLGYDRICDDKGRVRSDQSA